MTINGICPDCGAVLARGQSCESNFHQMLFWENEFPENAAQVHHLSVLCYHLQHPSLYSPRGLALGCSLLQKFTRDGISTEEARKIYGAQVGSNRRSWKIRGTDEGKGCYPGPMDWEMKTTDVIAGGPPDYCLNVKRWAEAILHDLEKQDWWKGFVIPMES